MDADQQRLRKEKAVLKFIIVKLREDRRASARRLLQLEGALLQARARIHELEDDHARLLHRLNLQQQKK